MTNRSFWLLLLTLSGCAGESNNSVSPQSAQGGPLQVKTGQPSLTPAVIMDGTAAWNVNFTHDSGARGDLLFPEMMGGGVAIFDADNDLDLDLYFINGAPQLGASRERAGPSNQLFLQGEDGRFVDSTARSGLGDRGYGTGVAVGDINNDGNEDVFVSNIGPDRLYRGNGDGTFEDVSETAGIVGSGIRSEEWSSSAVFCDIDRDGFLDLYVVHYVIFNEETTCTDKAGRREYCGPDSFEDRTDALLLNQGDGTFRDITVEAGIDRVTGAGLGVVCEDIDDDGWVDIYVANDGDPNQLWINQHDGTFIDDALIMGASVNATGNYEAGMGVVAADFDNDLDFDLFLTHLRGESNTFYRNLGPGRGFEDHSTRVGLSDLSVPYTGFGTVPIDLDLDGDLDLVIVNGRVLRGDVLTDSLPEPWNHYAEPNLIFLNENGVFELMDSGVEAFTGPIEVGRGLAVGDLDSDGTLDLVVTNVDGPTQLLRVEAQSSHWLLVDVFDASINRRALGSRVTVTSGEGRQRRTIQGAMSYLSSSDPRAHFGFGASGDEVSIAVRWPDGEEEVFDGIPVDQAIVLRRGAGSS